MIYGDSMRSFIHFLGLLSILTCCKLFFSICMPIRALYEQWFSYLLAKLKRLPGESKKRVAFHFVVVFTLLEAAHSHIVSFVVDKTDHLLVD